jgi:hypothetical protein
MSRPRSESQNWNSENEEPEISKPLPPQPLISGIIKMFNKKTVNNLEGIGNTMLEKIDNNHYTVYSITYQAGELEIINGKYNLKNEWGVQELPGLNDNLIERYNLNPQTGGRRKKQTRRPKHRKSRALRQSKRRHH